MAIRIDGAQDDGNGLTILQVHADGSVTAPVSDDPSQVAPAPEAGGSQLLTFQAVANDGEVELRFHLPDGHIGPCRLMFDRNYYGNDGDAGTNRTFTITNYLDDGFFEFAQDPFEVSDANSNMPSFLGFDPDMDLIGVDGESIVSLQLIRTGGSGGSSFVLVMEFTPA